MLGSTSHLWNGTFCFTSGVEYLQKLSGILRGRFSSSPLFIYIHMNWRFVSLNRFWILIQYDFMFLLNVYQLWPLVISSASSWVLLIYPHHCKGICFWIFCGGFLCISFLSGTTRCSRFILYISCHSPRISHFPKEPLFALLEHGIRNQQMGLRCAHCCWGITASRPA